MSINTKILLQPKPKTAYDKGIKDKFELINFQNNNSEIMGGQMMKMAYSLDYDGFEKIKTSVSLEKLKTKFKNGIQKMFNEIKKDKNIYFIEFLCGVNSENDPLKWTVADVIKGENKENKLIDALDNKSIIKLEIVIYEHDEFIPISNVYEFVNKGKNINRDKTTRDDIDSLKHDVSKFLKTKPIKYYKILKRIFLIARETKNQKLLTLLLNLFEKDDVSKIYFLKSKLETINKVLELYDDKLIIERVHKSLQKIKEEFSKQSLKNYGSEFFKQFDDLCKINSGKTIMKKLEKIINTENTFINNYLKKFIADNHIKIVDFKENKE